MKSFVSLIILALPIMVTAAGTTVNVDGTTFAGSTTIDLNSLATASATADSSSNAGVPLIVSTSAYLTSSFLRVGTLLTRTQTAAPLAMVGAIGLAHMLGQGF
jgi:hypothetical protein